MAGRSLGPFYAGLAVVAVVGGFAIVRSMKKAEPALTSETLAPLVTGPRGVVMGPDSAPVEIMEFSDFECPWCGRFAILQMPDVRSRLLPTGKVRWRFVNFPLTGHTHSPYAHLAASCANEQGKFWELHDIIYQNQEEWATSSNPSRYLEDYAQRAGLDMTRYKSCVSERRTWGQVQADKHLGDSLRLGGTPTFFVNGRMIPDNVNVTVDLLLHMVDSITAAPAAGARGASKQPRS